jgi:cell division initiation protein
MRISPQDIRQQQFTVKMFRGFDPQEVDAFLEDVADDYEALLKECQLLREQVATFEERQRGLADLEKALQDTLVTSQRLADELKAAARREAEEVRTAARHESELIVREAELRGEKAIEAARGDEARLRAELQALKRLRRQLVEDLAATLDRYRRHLEGDADEGPDGE